MEKKMSVTRRMMLAGMAVCAFGFEGPAHAQTSLKVMVFPSLANLPIYVADRKGFYTERGLAVEVLHTPNSDVLRNGLAKGDHQIVHAAVDNAVAMAEVAKVDIVVFLGGDGGWNSLFVRPEINSYDEIRGKIVGVDAPDTAYALLLYKMLDLKGVKKGEYQVKPIGGTHQRIEAMLNDKSIVASMLNAPFSIRAEREGLKNFGQAVAVTGPYQAGAAWALRPWAQANGDTLTKYIQAHVKALRWALTPENKAEASAILAERLRVTSDVAGRAYDMGLDPNDGFAKDAKFNLEGFTNVLKLRAETLGTWGGAPPSPSKYLDMSYFERALAGL
jgi:ABC-type nitrate/sulfonate/bicarbonate transport system substrate-binding protein